MPYEDHPVTIPPADDSAKVWRYMDLSQFMSLLERRSLYFTRADRFEDPFEGKYPRGNYEDRKSLVEEYREWWESIAAIHPELNPEEEVVEEVVEPLKSGPLLDDFNSDRMFFLNCWHMNEYESAAMWDNYLKSDEGIAIQSRFDRLKSALQDHNYTIHIGKVQYLDYEEETIPEDNALWQYLCKRKSFQHERELRMLFDRLPHTGEVEYDEDVQAPAKRIDWSEQPKGIHISVDLDKLIDAVYVAPTSPSWITDLIRNILGTYNVECIVNQSELFDEPPY